MNDLPARSSDAGPPDPEPECDYCQGETVVQRQVFRRHEPEPFYVPCPECQVIPALEADADRLMDRLREEDDAA